MEKKKRGGGGISGEESRKTKVDCARPKRHEEGVSCSTRRTLQDSVLAGGWGWGPRDHTRLEKRVGLLRNRAVSTHTRARTRAHRLLTVGSDADEQDVNLSE